jgi:hypothetical protein
LLSKDGHPAVAKRVSKPWRLTIVHVEARRYSMG